MTEREPLLLNIDHCDMMESSHYFCRINITDEQNEESLLKLHEENASLKELLKIMQQKLEQDSRLPASPTVDVETCMDDVE